MHASNPDVYLSLMCLAVGRDPGLLDKAPPPAGPRELHESSYALVECCRQAEEPAMDRAEPSPRPRLFKDRRPSASGASKGGTALGGGQGSIPLMGQWSATSIGLLALTCREGLRMAAAVNSRSASPDISASMANAEAEVLGASEGNNDDNDDGDGNADGEADGDGRSAQIPSLCNEDAPTDSSSLDAEWVETIQSTDDDLYQAALLDTEGSSAAISTTNVGQQQHLAANPMEIVALFVAVLPSVRTLVLSSPLGSAAFTQPSEFLSKLCSAVGPAWLAADAARTQRVDGQSDDPPHPDAAAGCDAVVGTLSSLLAAPFAECPSALLTTEGLAALDLLLDPLPSRTSARVPFETWLRFQRELLGRTLATLHGALANRSRPLSEQHAKALALLYRRVVRFQAILLHPAAADKPQTTLATPKSELAAPGVTATPTPAAHAAEPAMASTASPGPADTVASTDNLPHAELLAVALILVERGVGSDTAGGIRSTGVAAAAGAAAVSSMLSWVRSKGTSSGGAAGSGVAAAADAARAAAAALNPARAAAAALNPAARHSEVSAVLGCALRLVCSRFPPRARTAAQRHGVSAQATPDEKRKAPSSPPASQLLPLLGDVAMVLTTLSLEREEGVDHAGLAAHRSLAQTLAWRLFGLFDHGDRDVQRGAISQWVALLSQAKWLEREAFGDSQLIFDWQPLHSGNLGEGTLH